MLLADCKVDPADRHLLDGYSWYLDHGYARAMIKGNPVYMHRLIMGLPEQNIDHKNGDKLDNRRSNLRLCTQSQNMANTGISKANKTGYKGVFWRKERAKFVAYIVVNRKRKHLGYFTQAIDAAKVYDQAAMEAWGEFAIVNSGNCTG